MNVKSNEEYQVIEVDEIYSPIQPLNNPYDNPKPPLKRIIVEEAPHRSKMWPVIALSAHVCSAIVLLIVFPSTKLAIVLGLVLAFHAHKVLDK